MLWGKIFRFETVASNRLGISRRQCPLTVRRPAHTSRAYSRVKNASLYQTLTLVATCSVKLSRLTAANGVPDRPRVLCIVEARGQSYFFILLTCLSLISVLQVGITWLDDAVHSLALPKFSAGPDICASRLLTFAPQAHPLPCEAHVAQAFPSLF